MNSCVSAAEVLGAVGARVEDDDDVDILDALDDDITSRAMREELARLQ